MSFIALLFRLHLTWKINWNFISKTIIGVVSHEIIVTQLISIKIVKYENI